MRVPIEQAIRGGDSDCRNRLIQKIFQLVGAGDQAGFRGMERPVMAFTGVHEKRDPDQTLFELRMASLLPVHVVADLENSYGERFLSQDAIEKLVVVTAAVEGFVDHKRVREITDEHPADITKTLSELSRDGYLNQSGHGRARSIDPPDMLKRVLTSQQGCLVRQRELIRPRGRYRRVKEHQPRLNLLNHWTSGPVVRR